MDALTALRWLSFLLWLANAVMFTGSATRSMFSRARERDEWWSQFWIASALVTCWGVRNVAMGPSLTGATYPVTCGLLVLSSLVAVSFLRHRYQYEGWRW